jgi:hypothetical protein
MSKSLSAAHTGAATSAGRRSAAENQLGLQRADAIASRSVPSQHSNGVLGPGAPTSRWLPLRDAALILGESTDMLRKRCERKAAKGADGAVEARFDGIVARKLGGRWRVLLSAEWAQPAVVGSPPPRRERRASKVGTP